MFDIIQNKIKNYTDIIKNVENNNYKWEHRDLETKLGKSNFHTLHEDDMNTELLNLILINFDKKTSIVYKFIQIQKYNPGDYILPHKDHVQLISKLHLCTLTTSDHDGLVCEDVDGKYHFIPDRAGQYIDFPFFSWHWVNPVRNKRYSLVIGE